MSNPNDFVIREGFPALRLPRATTTTTQPSSDSNSEKDASKNTNGDVETQPPIPQPLEITGPWIEGVEPLPRMDFWAQDDCIRFGNVELLWEDCRKVFTARTREEEAAYSNGATYFLPCQMKPRCALEQIVETIFKAHTKDLKEGVMIPEQSGAEWWTLVLENEDEEANQKSNNEQEDEEDEGDEVGMHFDADYGLEDQAPNLLLHPRVATVTYLTNQGAPTVVLQKRSPPPSDVKQNTLKGHVSKAWVSHPKIGKHMAFDGRLLHGAPATFFPSRLESSKNKDPEEPPAKRVKTLVCPQRVTLLVNIWVNHCPLDAEPLEDDVCETLAPVIALAGENAKESDTTTPFFQWTEPNLDRVPEMPATLLKSCTEDPAGEEEVYISNRLVSIKYNPKMEDLHKATRIGELVQLDFEKGTLTLEILPEDENETEGNSEKDTTG